MSEFTIDRAVAQVVQCQKNSKIIVGEEEATKMEICANKCKRCTRLLLRKSGKQ
jgi:hypothetical protein